MKISDFIALKLEDPELNSGGQHGGSGGQTKSGGGRSKMVMKIKVVTRQPKAEFFGVLDDGTLKIRLKAVPEQGKANKELIRFLSDELGVKTSSIEIISGVTDTVKMVRITDLKL